MRLKRALLRIAAPVAILTMVAAGYGTAFAGTNDQGNKNNNQKDTFSVSGCGVCAEDNASYNITWTVTNPNKTSDLKLTKDTDNDSAVVTPAFVGAIVPAGSSKTFVQPVSSTDLMNTTLTLYGQFNEGKWSPTVQATSTPVVNRTACKTTTTPPVVTTPPTSTTTTTPPVTTTTPPSTTPATSTTPVVTTPAAPTTTPVTTQPTSLVDTGMNLGTIVAIGIGVAAVAYFGNLWRVKRFVK
jgi:hypothetical protein